MKSHKAIVSLTAALLIILTMHSLAFAQTFYVKSGGTGNCSTWNKACGSIQQAINASTPRNGDQVWVAAGTYNENIVMNSTEGDGVAVIGGFVAGGTVPNPTANPTIVDGQHNILSVFKIDNCLDQNTRISGFTIQNGEGTFNQVFKLGGGVYIYNSSVTIENNQFKTDTADMGGAIYFDSCFNIAIRNNSFYENNATREGGCIYGTSQYLNIANNTFENNSKIGGNVGGAISIRLCSATIENNIFTNNGVSYNKGGAIAFDVCTSITIRNNRFYGNLGSVGGCIWGVAESVDINRNIFENNTASNGGAISLYQSISFFIRYNLFTNNTGTERAADIHIDSAYPSGTHLIENNVFIAGVGSGGSIFSIGTLDVVIANNTFRNLLYGGAIVITDHPDSPSTSTIYNNIIAESAATVLVTHLNPATVAYVDYNCLFNTTNQYDGAPFPGTHDIIDDPSFVSTSDWHLQGDSPCINTGSPYYGSGLDMDGEVRPDAGGQDIGADEYYPPGMFLQTMSMSFAKIGRYYKIVNVSVTIADSNGAPVVGATVTGSLSGPTGQGLPVTLNGTTNTSGVAAISWTTPLSALARGAYQFCVTDVVKTGYIYHPPQTGTCVSKTY